jgi:hypothetical protein
MARWCTEIAQKKGVRTDSRVFGGKQWRRKDIDWLSEEGE